MSDPVPRPGVYETYWRFAAERLAMFMRRVEGRPPPWTEDPILQEFKFCNTYRAADRVSQYMIRDVCYAPGPKQDSVFRATAFRTFSKPATWERLTAILGHAPGIEDLQDGAFARALDAADAEGNGLYTSAFILCANDAYGRGRKHRNHAALFKDMFVRGEAADRIVGAGGLEEVFRILNEFPLMGDFMSYQTAVDINYGPATDFSENDFTCPGPGAVRGLGKVFQSLGGLSPAQAIQWMVENQGAEFERLGLDFPGLWGRPLHAIDAQGLFCETDKYCRVAFPHLESNRVRIKARFQPASKGLQLWFPPKWGLNDKIPKGVVMAPRARQATLA